MKKSTRALLGMVVIDLLLAAGVYAFVARIQDGSAKLTVPPAEAIKTVTTVGGGAIGVVTGLLLVAFVVHRKRGN
jgi:hypothetical protein